MVNASGKNSDPASESTPLAAEPTHTSDSLAHTVPEEAALPRPPHGRYQIIEEYARGGLGRVSRAHDCDLGRDIAIKEMLSGGPIQEARFVREALITARLQHPGIVPIYEAGRWPDGTPFYAMKLVAGRPLRDLIAESTTVAQRISLLHHVIAVADAIAYAHGHNIIHRDLKPANVIVGEFGETIVIDWGLAKDLTTTEPAITDGGPFRVAASDGLTAAGDILGTPTYMAPEQERGEQVDQRVDVFAIGAMLWELCTAQKLPPADTRQRHRLLRRARIDRDLVAIIDKAIDPDPRWRYHDAGSLAADLKAFKSGARIAARRYSFAARVGHWMRRHRAIAVSATAAMVLALASGVFFVHRITTERDRAEASSNRLVLKHAELLLRSDPTAAFDLLGTYSGTDVDQLAMLRAEAQGLGLSSVIARPHAYGTLFAYPVANQMWVTLGGDGAVVKTDRDGQRVVLADDVTAPHAFAHSPRRHLLAYSCRATSLCVLDLQTGAGGPLPIDGSFTAISMAFSPSGELLAAISSEGETLTWRLADYSHATLQHERHLNGIRAISLVNDDTLAAQTTDHVLVTDLDPRSLAAPAELSIPGASNIATSAQYHLVATGTVDGNIFMIDSRTRSVVRQATVCKGPINKVVMLATSAGVAYACQDGDAGIWQVEARPQVLAHVDGGVADIAVAEDGRYAIIGGNSGRVLTYDFATQMLSSHLGHAARISELLPPTPESPYIVSADMAGAMRVWSPPTTTARAAITTAASMVKAVLLSHNGPLVALGTGTTIPWRRSDSESGALDGHDPSHLAMVESPTESRFATYGTNDEIELWSFESGTDSRKLKLAHGATMAVAYTIDGSHLVAGSSDGTITMLSKDGENPRELAAVHESVAFLRVVPNTDALVVGGESGRVWLVTSTGTELLGREASTIKSAVCSLNSKWLAVGTSGGLVRLYNLETRQAPTVVTAATRIKHLAFSPDSASLAITTGDSLTVSSVSEPARALWTASLSVGYISFSPDSQWLALTCDHGDIWFYRRDNGRWVYLSIGTARITFGKFSDNSAQFAVVDSSGRALLIDMSGDVFEQTRS